MPWRSSAWRAIAGAANAAASSMTTALPEALSSAPGCTRTMTPRKPTRSGAEAGVPAAGRRLAEDWERLVAFYAFPKAHWTHLRTTNVVESPFAAVRLRTAAAKRFKKVENATAVIWKTLCVAEQSFRRAIERAGILRRGESLSDEQVDTIVRWIDGGAPQGDPKDMPAAKQWPEDQGWNFAAQFGQKEPDLIIKSPKYTQKAVAMDANPRVKRKTVRIVAKL